MQKTILPLSLLVVGSMATRLASKETDGTEGPNMMPNMRPGLVPPEGTMWRGATIDGDGPLDSSWMNGTNPDDFEAYYGQPLHIFRNFNEKSNADLESRAEWDFI